MRPSRWALSASGLAIILSLLSHAQAFADNVSQAYRLHRRLAGTNPSASLLEAMALRLSAGASVEAALLAIDNEEHSFFYNHTLKKFFSPWFDREGSVSVPLNDGIATLIGMTRDQVSLQQMFAANLVYIGNGFGADLAASVRPPESGNNLHYQAMEREGVDLKSYLVPIRQTDPLLNPDGSWTAEAASGILTSRGFGSVFYRAGTNRAPVRFMLKNFLCADIDAFHDTTVPDDEVRRDPDRAPAGDPAIYNNKCKGCHAGMDPMSRAFAYLDFDDDSQKVIYTKPRPETPFDQVRCAANAEITLGPLSSYEEKLRCAVVDKYLNNRDSYPSGYVVKDDKWKNFWTSGNNARVGWPGSHGEILKGEGPKALGVMFAQTKAFPRCIAEQVMSHVCLATSFASQEIKDKIERLSADFVANNFDLKRLFAATAVACMGE